MIPNAVLDDLRRLLDELIAVLQREGESNWIRGALATRAYLDDPGGDRGYGLARSGYRMIVQGNGSFSDYYIPRADFTEQLKANERLDQLRDELWQLFEKS